MGFQLGIALGAGADKFRQVRKEDKDQEFQDFQRNQVTQQAGRDQKIRDGMKTLPNIGDAHAESYYDPATQKSLPNTAALDDHIRSEREKADPDAPDVAPDVKSRLVANYKAYDESDRVRDIGKLYQDNGEMERGTAMQVQALQLKGLKRTDANQDAMDASGKQRDDDIKDGTSALKNYKKDPQALTDFANKHISDITGHPNFDGEGGQTTFQYGQDGTPQLTHAGPDGKAVTEPVTQQMITQAANFGHLNRLGAIDPQFAMKVHELQARDKEVADTSAYRTSALAQQASEGALERTSREKTATDTNATALKAAGIQAGATLGAASIHAKAQEKAYSYLKGSAGMPMTVTEDGKNFVYQDGSTKPTPEGFDATTFFGTRQKVAKDSDNPITQNLAKGFAEEVKNIPLNSKTYQQDMAGVSKKYSALGLDTGYVDPLATALSKLKPGALGGTPEAGKPGGVPGVIPPSAQQIRQTNMQLARQPLTQTRTGVPIPPNPDPSMQLPYGIHMARDGRGYGFTTPGNNSFGTLDDAVRGTESEQDKAGRPTTTRNTY